MHETVIQMLFWETAQPSSRTSTLLLSYFFYAASAGLGAGWGRSEGKAGFSAWFPEEAGARLSAVRLRLRPHLYSLPGCHHPGRGLLPPAPSWPAAGTAPLMPMGTRARRLQPVTWGSFVPEELTLSIWSHDFLGW